MSRIITRRELPLSLGAPLMLAQMLKAAGENPPPPDPKVLTIKTPQEIDFPPKDSGNQQIVLFGDPKVEGSLYGIHFRWLPHSNSRPHMHKYDRHIYVLSGTWWLGSGEKYDMNTTYPVKPGSYVLHKGGEIHYDGAKDEPVILLVVGMGPAANLPLPGQTRANE